MDNSGYNYFKDTSLDDHHSFLIPRVFEILNDLRNELKGKNSFLNLDVEMEVLQMFSQKKVGMWLV